MSDKITDFKPVEKCNRLLICDFCDRSEIEDIRKGGSDLVPFYHSASTGLYVCQDCRDKEVGRE